MPVSKNQISGNTSMLLLKLLSEKDMYGYEMIDTLSERSKNVFELKVGTLYPLLHSLVQSGYLSSYEQQVNGKLRKYYQITSGGRRYLDKMMDEWNTYASAVGRILGKTSTVQTDILYG